jgi:hypothetical protein
MSRIFQYPKWKACVILISLGIFIFVAFGISNLKRDYQSLYWPFVSGVIRSATLEHSDFYSGPNASQHTFWPDISYDYQVAGVSYSSTRVSFGGLWQIYYNRSNKSQAARVLDHYPKGRQVSVFYDPSDPGIAILEPKITDRTWTPLAFSVLFLLWGTLPIIYFVIRTRYGKIDAA